MSPPGPTCQICNPVDIKDGTINLQPSPIPGSKKSDYLDSTCVPDDPHILEYTKKIASSDDFASFVEEVEKANPDPAEIFKKLLETSGCIVWKNNGSKGVKRYLLSMSKEVGIIDMKHFFTSAAETYGNLHSGKPLNLKANQEERTLFLGVVNELAQTFMEPESAFSPEDLVSNRLGAEFATKIKSQETLPKERREPFSKVFRAFINEYNVSPHPQVEEIRTQCSSNVMAEAGSAFFSPLNEWIR